jgi:hypothetical protein
MLKMNYAYFQKFERGVHLKTENNVCKNDGSKVPCTADSVFFGFAFSAKPKTCPNKINLEKDIDNR